VTTSYYVEITEKTKISNIIVNSDSKLTTQIGPKWNNFSRINEFRPRYTVRFKFSINNCYVCYVFHIKYDYMSNFLLVYIYDYLFLKLNQCISIASQILNCLFYILINIKCLLLIQKSSYYLIN